MPVVAWNLFARLGRRYPCFTGLVAAGRDLAVSATRRRDRIRFVALFLVSFLLMELLWRMMFEFLFASLEMHEALLLLNKGANTH